MELTERIGRVGLWHLEGKQVWHLTHVCFRKSTLYKLWVLDKLLRSPNSRTLNFGYTFLAKGDFNKDQLERRKISNPKTVMLLVL